MWLQTLPAAVFIIDCNWNMNTGEVARKAGPLVAQPRAADPPFKVSWSSGMVVWWYGGMVVW